MSLTEEGRVTLTLDRWEETKKKEQFWDNGAIGDTTWQVPTHSSTRTNQSQAVLRGVGSKLNVL